MAGCAPRTSAGQAAQAVVTGVAGRASEGGAGAAGRVARRAGTGRCSRAAGAPSRAGSACRSSRGAVCVGRARRARQRRAGAGAIRTSAAGRHLRLSQCLLHASAHKTPGHQPRLKTRPCRVRKPPRSHSQSQCHSAVAHPRVQAVLDVPRLSSTFPDVGVYGVGSGWSREGR